MKGASTDELKRAIAAVFLGEGLEKMSEEQMLSAISMKRRWFTPEKASVFIENGKKAGLIVKKGRNLLPSFRYKEIEIPFGYYPPESVLEYVGEDIMERIRSEWKLSEDEINSALSMEYNLEDEAKILLWGAQNGKDYYTMVSDVEEQLIKKYKKS